MGPAWHGLGLVPLVAVALTACSAGASSDDGGEPQTAGDMGDQTSDGGPGLLEASDGCVGAPSVGAGRWRGTLSKKASSLSGACGQGGPDAFFDLNVAQRADVELVGVGVGFTPRVGVLGASCRDAWEEAQLLCTAGLPGWVLDVSGGTDLVVSVGIDPNDPALGGGEPDPLEFIVDIRIRRVLEAGDPCSPPQLGRCVSGTACLPDVDDGATGAGTVLRCTELPADICANAEPLMLTDGPVDVIIDPARPQTDSHHHTCVGARKRDRVYRLTLPTDTAPATTLEIMADVPDVGLAIRLPGCDAGEEVGCTAGGTKSSRLMLEDVDALAGAGVRPYLFVELPGGAEDGPHATGDPAPFSLHLSLAPVP